MLGRLRVVVEAVSSFVNLYLQINQAECLVRRSQTGNGYLSWDVRATLEFGSFVPRVLAPSFCSNRGRTEHTNTL